MFLNLGYKPDSSKDGWVYHLPGLGFPPGGWGEAWGRRQYQRQEWGIGRGPQRGPNSGSWAQNWGGLNRMFRKIQVIRKRARNKRGILQVSSELDGEWWWYGSHFCVDGSHWPPFQKVHQNHFLKSFSLQLFIAFPLIQFWKANNMLHGRVSKYQHSSINSINIYQHSVFPFINIYQPLSTFINIHPAFSKTTLIMEVS